MDQVLNYYGAVTVCKTSCLRSCRVEMILVVSYDEGEGQTAWILCHEATTVLLAMAVDQRIDVVESDAVTVYRTSCPLSCRVEMMLVVLYDEGEGQTAWILCHKATTALLATAVDQRIDVAEYDAVTVCKTSCLLLCPVEMMLAVLLYDEDEGLTAWILCHEATTALLAKAVDQRVPCKDVGVGIVTIL